MAGLNAMHQFHGLALARDNVKPAARHHQVFRQAQNFVSNGIAVMVVIKQPGIEIALMQGKLNGFKVHKRFFYLTTLTHWTIVSPRKHEKAALPLPCTQINSWGSWDRPLPQGSG